MVLAQDLVLLGDILLSKRLLELIPPLLQFEDQLVEALVDVAGLLLVQALDFLLDVLNELPIVIIDPLGIEHQLVQIVDVLLDDVCDIFELG